ncbi:MAG: DUF4824 family protein [Pseudomonadota bacterium]
MKLNTKILIAGAAIIIATNAIALIGVAYNRSGEPDAIVDLTERELGMPYDYGFDEENSGLALRINCRVENNANNDYYNSYSCFGIPNWLNEEKLIQLGFDLNQDTTEDPYEYRNRQLPQKVYIVMEYNGPAHQRAIDYRQQELAKEQALLANNPDNEEFKERVKDATAKLEAEQHYNGRLFVIDAGLDKDQLRRQYAEPGRYVIMQALIRPNWTTIDKQAKWVGHITELLIDQINIPYQHRSVFTEVEGDTVNRSQNQHPRYQVRVAFGKRNEPWVLGAEKIESSSKL